MMLNQSSSLVGGCATWTAKPNILCPRVDPSNCRERPYLEVAASKNPSCRASNRLWPRERETRRVTERERDYTWRLIAAAKNPSCRVSNRLWSRERVTERQTRETE